MNTNSNAAGAASVLTEMLCGCGRPVRYMTQTGYACNKHQRCLTYEELSQALAQANMLILAYRSKRAIELGEENKRLRAALERIAKWEGEFPATGRYWDEPKNTKPMSYSACYGSYGERDYMRQVAQDALRAGLANGG